MNGPDLVSPIADPSRRLAAWLLDWAILTLPTLVLLVALMLRDPGPALAATALGVFGLLALLALNALWVHRRGQSIGKRLCGLRVVAIDGSRIGLVRILLLRNAVPLLIGAIPFAGSLFHVADSLFIFSRHRRTVRDMIAGSIVVAVESKRA